MIPQLTPEEIRDSGILQEINRRLLHPRGLAMFVTIDADEGEQRVGIFTDDDPEGWGFGGDDWESEARGKAARFDALLKPDRESALGYVEQPLP
jgi:hypothetical protein